MLLGSNTMRWSLLVLAAQQGCAGQIRLSDLSLQSSGCWIGATWGALCACCTMGLCIKDSLNGVALWVCFVRF